MRRPTRPNILFCIADDASFPHMSAYGCQWVRTPGFDRVARDGLLFSRAYTPNAKCAPSRACILTGRNSWQLEEAANHWCFFPDKFTTYVEALEQHGYVVGYTGKGWAPGVVGKRNGQPRHLTGPAFEQHRTTPPTRAISNKDYTANFKQFLDDRDATKPFCFWYGGHEPHRGYEYGSGIAKGGKTRESIDRVQPYWPDTEAVRTDLLDYAFELEHFDTHLNRMLSELEQRDELENTLVVVTADNGMPFPRIKGQEYEYSNHLPLAMMWKRGIRNPGRTVEDYVSFIDFAPTFLALADITPEAGGMQPIQGRPLTDIFASGKSGQTDPERNRVLIGKERHDVGRPHDEGYPIRGIVKDGYLFVHNFQIDRWPAGNPETGYLNCDGGPTKTACIQARHDPATRHIWNVCFGKRPANELYHVEDDPECIHNLAENPEQTERLENLKSELFAELKRQGDPRMDGHGDLFDNYPYADGSGRDFYERYMRGEKLNFGWVSKTDFDPDAAKP